MDEIQGEVKMKLKLEKNGQDSLFDDPEFRRMKNGLIHWAIGGAIISVVFLTGAIVTIIWAIKHL